MSGESAFLEMRALNNLAMRYIVNNFHHNEIDRLTVGNGWIIEYIFANKDTDIFQKDIEEHFSITRSTVSKVVDCMVSKGLIERKSVSGDARLRKLVLTEKALDIVDRIKQYETQFEEQLLKGFTKEERAQFTDYINRIKNNIIEKV